MLLGRPAVGGRKGFRSILEPLHRTLRHGNPPSGGAIERTIGSGLLPGRRGQFTVMSAHDPIPSEMRSRGQCSQVPSAKC
jgi:hypothetical protein